MRLLEAMILLMTTCNSDFTEFIDSSSALGGGTEDFFSFPGVGVFDCDNDGYEDIFFPSASGQRHRLYINQHKDPVEFNEEGAQRGFNFVVPNDRGDFVRVHPVDLNNDGNVDIVISYLYKMIEIYINIGKCQFKDVTTTVFPAFNTFVVTQGNNRTWGGQIASSDYDHDGDLDLLLASWGDAAPPFSRYPAGAATIILRNNQRTGNPYGFILKPLTTNPPLPANSASYICPAVWEDFDEDGWDDIVLSSCGDVGPGPTFFWKNTRNAKTLKDGTIVPKFPNGPNNIPLTKDDRIFVDVSNNIPPFGFYGVLSIGMSLSFGDLNNDLHGDFVLTNYGSDAPNSVTSGRTLPIFLFKSLWYRGKLAKYVSVGESLNDPKDGNDSFTKRFGWGDAFIDLDNDGFDDVIHNGIVPGLLGNPGLIFQNDRGKRLSIRQNLGLIEKGFAPHSVAHGDFNNDGYLDFALGTGCSPDPSGTGCEFRGDLLFINNGENIASLDNRFFLDISLRGNVPDTNFYGIGSLVQLKIFSGRKLLFIKNGKSRAGTNLASTSSNIVHFGWLKPGNVKEESLKATICVRWNGKNSDNPQQFDVKLNERLIIEERSQGGKSCEIFKNPGIENGVKAFERCKMRNDRGDTSGDRGNRGNGHRAKQVLESLHSPNEPKDVALDGVINEMLKNNHKNSNSNKEIKIYLITIIVIGSLIFATLVLCLGYLHCHISNGQKGKSKYMGVENTIM